METENFNKRKQIISLLEQYPDLFLIEGPGIFPEYPIPQKRFIIKYTNILVQIFRDKYDKNIYFYSRFGQEYLVNHSHILNIDQVMERVSQDIKKIFIYNLDLFT